MNEPRSLSSGFIESSQRFPDRPALQFEDTAVTYEALYEHVAAQAACLLRHRRPDAPPLTAVLAQRSLTAYSGVLAALFSGHGYVPLNPGFPPERSRLMLEQAGCRTVIVDYRSPGLDQVLGRLPEPCVLLFPDLDDVGDLAAQFQAHKVLGSSDIYSDPLGAPITPNADSIAYLLFTSGSTGDPKGVMVSHQNVLSFLNVMKKRYALRETDRFSQLFDMIFDLSVFDMFMAWEVGGCVCIPSSEQLFSPAEYVRASEITVWFSVPSVAVLMKRLGFLEPGAFSNLSLSLFCGEALPADIASAWAATAPNSVVENLYGPTEVTLACTAYRWKGEESLRECENGIVPLGEPLPELTATIADDALGEVEPGREGELLMAGPQVALGYWKNPTKTAEAFVKRPGSDTVYYRTGDLVRKREEQGPLLYLGRIDHQIKIHGSRVELGEIEAVLRDVAKVERAVALGWPVNGLSADGIVAFLETTDADIDEVLEAARKRLPRYMLPREVRLLAEFPLNQNGKIDRKAMMRLLEG